MPVQTILLISAAVNLTLCAFVQYRRYHHALTIPLFGLALLLPLHTRLGTGALQAAAPVAAFIPYPLFFAVSCAAALGFVHLAGFFLRDLSVAPAIRLRGVSIRSLPLLYGAGALLVGATLAFPAWEGAALEGAATVLVMGGTGTLFTVAHLLLVIYALFTLETTYRFADGVQRKIGRICMLSLFVLLVTQVVFSARLLLFRTLSMRYVELSGAIHVVCFPFFTIGLLRYRLGSERISIPRDAVYSSISVLLIGAAFLGIGLTTFVFKVFDLDFSYFNRTLAVFFLSFTAVLAIGSGEMRKRIISFVNTRFYRFKYDYRDQFFRLHRSFMTGEEPGRAITDLVENMKYAVTVNDAFVFIRNPADGRYTMHENKERGTATGIAVDADDPLVRELERSAGPIVADPRKPPGSPREGSMGALLGELKISHLFPIAYKNETLAILALSAFGRGAFDQEDREFIGVFTNAIADVLFKNRVLRERIEQKQFESFSHLSSFLIHDIKNQVATLSLLARNADTNITDPEFQKSALASIKSCTTNLQALLTKLQSPPRSTEMKPERGSVAGVVDRVLENTGIANMADVSVTFNSYPMDDLRIDPEALFYVVKNLVMNALEAMGFHGSLTVTVGELRGEPGGRVAALFSGNETVFARFHSFILVEDTGCGMSASFIEERLFHPFSTTKDKGIGIGLYQCKTLVEKMGGRILCASKEGEGTRFCILLN